MKQNVNEKKILIKINIRRYQRGKQKKDRQNNGQKNNLISREMR
jgi:hypothetical protein